MNKFSIEWSENQTEEQMKATTAGSHRILETRLYFGSVKLEIRGSYVVCD